MAENENNGNENATPDPAPVYDISASHVWDGHVHGQFYGFLWLSVAFLLGSILSWDAGDGGMGALQAFICVMAIRAVWSSIAAIRSFRPDPMAVFMLELVLIVAVGVHYKSVQENRETKTDAVLAEFVSSHGGALTPQERELYDELSDASDWGVMDMMQAPVSLWLSEPGSPERVKSDRAWNSFGAGFHVTWITMIVTFLFTAVSIFSAVRSTKKKKQERPARKRSTSNIGGSGDGVVSKDGADSGESDGDSSPPASF